MLTTGILICCTCHFQSGSHCLFGFLCLLVSSVSNFCLDTRGKGGLLFRLTCSVLLWGGRNTASKYHWHVWGVLAVSGPHWVCPWSRHVLSWSTLLRLQVVLLENHLRWALGCMHFPGINRSGSGSWVLRKGTDSVRLAFFAFPRSKQLRQPGTWQVHCVAGPCVLISSQVLATQFPGCIMRAPSQVHRVSPLGS